METGSNYLRDKRLRRFLGKIVFCAAHVGKGAGAVVGSGRRRFLVAPGGIWGRAGATGAGQVAASGQVTDAPGTLSDWRIGVA